MLMISLNDSVSKLSLVGPVYQKRLKKLEIKKINHLLLHVPHRYEDYRMIHNAKGIKSGQPVTLVGKVVFARNQYTRTNKKIQLLEVENDLGGTFLAIWFNQPFLVRNFKKGEMLSLSGKIDWFGRKLALISPEYEKIIPGETLIHTGRVVSIYPETKGVSSKWIRRRIWEILNSGFDTPDYLDDKIRDKYNLMCKREAINKVHFPANLEEAEEARKRLAFDELLVLQAQNLMRRGDWQTKQPTFRLKVDDRYTKEFIDSLPFKLTASQKEAVSEILQDLGKEVPMNRLLEGDVGSGKTVVAAIASLNSFINGYKSIFMAPTQILAEQHFDTLNKLFQALRVRISLITSAGIKTGPGRSDIIIGTHALIYNKLDISDSALVVIDEQHRFGVEQRASLMKLAENKRKIPHVLTMTATPIPRTVALTFYGDLSLSTLRELPSGRKPITTWIVPPQKRRAAYRWVREQIKNDGIQAFVVCPLIEESEVETMKQVRSAKTEFDKLRKSFLDLRFGLIHGRLKAKEKQEVIKKFREKEIDILVATPVVEVGIDIPNATIIVIEAAERFGLAQLHQLRGRVGRGLTKSYCLLFTEKESQKVQGRLAALRESKSGFELAELDLEIRGPGEIFGYKQHGVPELKIASWQDIQIIKDSKKLAEEIFENPQKYQKIIRYFKSKEVASN